MDKQSAKSHFLKSVGLEIQVIFMPRGESALLQVMHNNLRLQG